MNRARFFCRNPHRLRPAGYGGGRSPGLAARAQTPRARTTRLAPGAQLPVAALFSKSHLRCGKYRTPAWHFPITAISPPDPLSDLIDHRLVKFALGLKDYQDAGNPPRFLDALKRSSFLERRAQDAERELNSIKAARYLNTRLGDEFKALLSASGGGLHVHLVEVGLEARSPARTAG